MLQIAYEGFILPVDNYSECLPTVCRSGEDAENDWAKTPIGAITKGAVHDVKDYGVVCDLEANPDVVGLAASHQAWLLSCRPRRSQTSSKSLITL